MAEEIYLNLKNAEDREKIFNSALSLLAAALFPIKFIKHMAPSAKLASEMIVMREDMITSFSALTVFIKMNTERKELLNEEYQRITNCYENLVVSHNIFTQFAQDNITRLANK